MEIKDIISSGLLESYSMGLATEAESQQVVQWANQYPEVAAELKAIQDSLEQYAMAQAAQPSENVKTALFSKLNLEEPVPMPAKVIPISSNRWKWFAAASIILLLGSVVGNMILYNKYQETSRALATTGEALQDATKRNSEMEKEGKIITNPTSIPVSLKGIGTMSDAMAKIFWIPQSGDVFVDASHLPEPPPGKQYQFWGIVNGVPVDGGLIIKTNDGSFHLQRMKAFGKAEAFAISLENAGGNPTPTKVVSMGKII